jgi:hypothetical protein
LLLTLSILLPLPLAKNFLLLLLLLLLAKNLPPLLLPYLSGRRVLPLCYRSRRLRDILLLRWLPHLTWSVVAPLGDRRLRCRVLRRTALRPAAGSWLCSPNPAHIHHPNRCNRCRGALANLLDFRHSQRTPGIPRQRCLLSVKWHCRRRRRGSSHHWPAQHIGRRTRSAGRAARAGSENAIPLRSDGRSRYHLGRR